MSHAKQLHHRRYLNDYLEIIKREGLPGNVKNDVCRKVQATVIATVQHVIEAALDEESARLPGGGSLGTRALGAPTRGDPQWQLSADIAHAVRGHC